LDLFPIAVFAVAAYVTLSATGPQENTRLVALAWVNAAIIVRIVLAAGRLVFAPAMANLRLLPVTDATALYADRWIRRLTFTAVYGYFALQAALLLGLYRNVYEALLRLLGLSIALMVVVFIVQNRAAVARLIRGADRPEGKVRLRALRNRLAQIWHLLAILYVFLLYGIWALEISGGFAFLLKATVLTLLILVIARFVADGLAAFVQRGLSLGRELRNWVPGLERRINRYIPAAQTGLRWLVYLLAGLAILEAWEVDTFDWLASEPGQVLTSTALTILGIIVGSLAVWEIATSLIEANLAETDRFGRARIRSARTRTLLTVTRNALFVILLVVSVLLVLAELGVNITPLLAGAGVLGIAVGFGAQKLVQDVITGVFILFEDLISVGDVVNVGDKGGLVEAVSIRNVRLRGLDGTVHTVPYSAIGTISNLTKDFSYYVFDVGVAYREDVDQVMEVLKDIGRNLQADSQFAALILEPLEILGVDAFQDSAVLIKARIKTLPIKQWTVGREFNRRMKKRFDELGIEIPFPHRTLYFGVDRSGDAPAARVELGSGAAAEFPYPVAAAANPGPRS
ncbi:MAG: mechanosensitive ion channel, partial [Pseudomonadota bacterium]|nr:mechanosensitive ion channel [Pseudomonadota bacterium]